MTRRIGHEHGFTLVELQVSMVIMLVIAFAALAGLEAFTSGAARTTALTVAEDAARRDLERIVGVLRDAGAPPPVSGAQPATVIQSLPNDLVFRSSTWPGESGVGQTGTHTARLCLDTATHTLWFDGLRAGTAGPTTPGAACPSAASGWTHLSMATNVINSAADPVFQYGSATAVRSVGVSLRLEGGTVSKSRPLVLRSGGALRGALAPQVTAADIVKSACEGGKALLTFALGAVGTSTEGAKLSAPNATTAGTGKILVPAGSSPVDVPITITNVLGLQTLLTKQVSCP
jgi:prepilin-type N-terminal cleavage/methylation domain-containing protein